MSDDKMEIACCNKCKESFNCEILFAKHTSLDHIDYGYIEKRVHYIIKCPKCNNIFFKEKTEFMDKQNNDSNDIFEDYFPNQESEISNKIYEICVMLTRIKHKSVLIHLLHEIRKAFDSNSYMIIAMGIRTCIDIICRQLTGNKVNGYRNSIRLCIDKGFISQNQFDIINPVIELGNESVHNDYMPNKIEVELAMQVVLNITESQLIHADVVKEVLTEKINQNKRMTNFNNHIEE